MLPEYSKIKNLIAVFSVCLIFTAASVAEAQLVDFDQISESVKQSVESSTGSSVSTENNVDFDKIFEDISGNVPVDNTNVGNNVDSGKIAEDAVGNIPENNVPENSLPTNAVPEKPLPDNTIPKDNVPTDTISKAIESGSGAASAGNGQNNQGVDVPETLDKSLPAQSATTVDTGKVVNDAVTTIPMEEMLNSNPGAEVGNVFDQLPDVTDSTDLGPKAVDANSFSNLGVGNNVNMATSSFSGSGAGSVGQNTAITQATSNIPSAATTASNAINSANISGNINSVFNN